MIEFIFDYLFQFDLENVFNLYYISIVFRSYFPDKMKIEKSIDFGQTFTPIFYFAKNCNKFYPNIPTNRTVAKAYCREYSRYHSVTSNGEVVFH